MAVLHPGMGRDRLLSGESLIAEVPSLIVPEESNLLLNPCHPALREVVAEMWLNDRR